MGTYKRMILLLKEYKGHRPLKRRYQHVDFSTRALLPSKLRMSPGSEYIILPPIVIYPNYILNFTTVRSAQSKRKEKRRFSSLLICDKKLVLQHTTRHTVAATTLLLVRISLSILLLLCFTIYIYIYIYIYTHSNTALIVAYKSHVYSYVTYF